MRAITSLRMFYQKQCGRPPLTGQDLIACLILVGVATLAVLPVFVVGLPSGDDASTHFHWAMQFNQTLREGVLYPRWLAAANNGQGSPAMLYYPPLPFYVVAAFNALFASTIKSLALGCWVALVLSGLTMYAFSRSILSPWLSVGSSALYLLAPYHLFDLYQGSALSEYWSFVWVPLLLDAIRRVASGQGRRAVAYLAISYALLILTHIPIAFAATLAIPLFTLALTLSARRLGQVAGGLILGLAVSAIFLLPVSLETKYVRIGRVLRFDYERFFLYEHIRLALKTKFFSPDLSTYSFSDSFKPKFFLYVLRTDQVALGLPILLTLVTLVIILERRSGNQPLWRSKLVRAAWLVTAVSLLMTTRLTSPIWRVVPKLPYLQFPSRWLVIVATGVSLLTAEAVSSLVRRERLRIFFAAALGAAVVLNLTLSVLEIARAPHDADAFDTNALFREVPDYRPVWWDNDLHEDWDGASAIVIGGQANVNAMDDSGSRQSYVVNAVMPSTLVMRPLYFPGWVARLDGTPMGIAPSEGGNIQLTVEPGEHTLALSFEDTLPRTMGKLVSLAGLLALIAMLYPGSRGDRI